MSRRARATLLAAAALALLPLGAPAVGLPGRLAPRRDEPIKAMVRRTPLLEPLIASGRIEVLDQYSQGESPLILVRGAETDLRAGSNQRMGRRVSDRIHLRSRVIDSTQARPPIRPSAVGGRLEIVQFHGPIKPRWLAQLRSGAARPIAYLPENAYLVWAEQPDRLASAGLPMQWREPFTEQDRLSPELVSTSEPTDVTIQVARAGRHEQVLDEILSLATIVLMEPRPLGPMTHVRVRLPGGAAEWIARHAEVVWIEPFERPTAHDERSALTIAGLVSKQKPLAPGYQSWLESKGLGDLSAVLVDVADSGIDRGPAEPSHPCLQGRVVYAVDGTGEGDLQDCVGHGTNVAGIIAGSPGPACELQDEEGYSLPLGVAPTARLGATRIFTCAGIFGPSAPFTDLVAAAYDRGARLGNNSWGGSGSQYNTLTAEYDALVRDANLDPRDGDQAFLPIFSAGNLGPAPLSVGWPATAKNVLSVGATESSRPGTDGCGTPELLADSVDHVLIISGRGPTGDGRIKPDLVAPGSHIISLASTAPGYDGVGVCDPYFPVGQRLLNWSTGTSQAAAHASGAAVVASEVYRRRHGVAPSPAMIKATLIAHAHDMAFTVQFPSNTGSRPNADQGWGRVDLGRLVDSTTDMAVDQRVVFKSTGESASFEPVVVEDPTRPVVVTLVWTDAPGTPAGWSWVNDLDLVVKSGGATYLGNVIQRGISVTGGEADPRNNVEVVILPAGQTLLSVQVEAANIAGDGVPSIAGETDQDFALYASNVRLPLVAGTVSLPQGSATCGSSLEVRVSDLSLRGFGRARVRVDSGADTETVRLDESPPGSGAFKATVAVAGGAPSPEDGVIQAADGVDVTATYVEPDPESGELVERLASVPGRCVPPVISAARVARSGGGEAIIAWETDRPSTSVVSFGQGAVRDRQVIDLRPVTRHRVRLSGLPACALHTATVRSADSAGSSVEAPATPLRFSTGTPSVRRTLFRDDMEGLGSPWEHHALPDDPLATDDWELGFPAAGPPGPFSGARAWGTNLDGAYSERLDAVLVSPPIDLREAFGSQLTFMHYYSINGALPPNSRNDGGWVEISTDGGASWAPLDPIGGYTDLIDEDNPHLADDSFVYAGTTTGWIRATFDLSTYDGNVVRIRFHIWQDAGESAPPLFGWYIDDVEVTAKGACHQARLTLDSDEYGCSSRVVIMLEDSDLDLDHNRVNTAQVTASSASGNLTVSLLEAGPASGTFRGEVMTQRTPSPGGLVVSQGDTITVTYADADSGDGSPSVTTASALVPDCAPPPAPLGVAASTDGSRRLMVTWNPVEPSAAPDLQGYRIHYDTDGSGPSYAGTGALQGASPVRVEASLSAAGLSSLGACSGYFITVTAFDRLGNESAFAPESFAVADGPQPCAIGRISVAPASPGCAQLVSVTITDSNLDADPSSPGTAMARATGPSQAGGVPVTLVESSPFSGVYVGTLSLTPSPQAGALEVSEGDEIRLEYSDADDGFGAARTASTSALVGDCAPPAISGVEVTDARSDTAVVRWITDEPASSTVRYGFDATSLGLVLSSPALTTQHSIRIRRLSPCSPVFFTVSSADAAANSATATDSGSPFRFGTFRDIPILVDDFGSGAPGWTHAGLGSSPDEWELGLPLADPNGPPPPYSGGMVWGTDLDGPYDKGADIVLVSPPIDLTEVASAYLQFRHWYQIASSPGPPNGFDDGGFLEVSRDGGETWQHLTHGDPQSCSQGQPDCYPDHVGSNPYTPFAAGAYGGSSGGWVTARVSLDEHVGHVIRVRFHLYQDADEIGLPRALGWYIDDVAVTFGEACRAGRISFDRSEYPCSSEARLVLSDLDLDADPSAVESASVLVASEAEPDGEILTLAETGPSTGLFQAVLPISSTGGPGVLQVRDHDSITAVYADADDGTGLGADVTALARVLDCIPPVASGVRVASLSHSGFTVAWETTEPATGRVLFGPDPSLGGATAPGTLGTHHAVAVSGLAPCRLHHFTVESKDPSGNTAREDATAGPRQVTTLGQVVVLEEGFESAAPAWRRSGRGSGWQVGGPSDPPPPSGSGAAGAPLSGSYLRPREVNDDYVLESPPFNLAGLVEPTLTFQHTFEFASSFLGGDGGRVEAWDGSRWIALTPVGGYPGFLDAEVGRTGERVPGYSGSSSGYVPARFDLGMLGTGLSRATKIRFRVFVEGGAGPTGRGWRIDDVRIVGTVPCRLARLAFDRGEAACEAQVLRVTLHDTDLDLDPLASDAAAITAESSGGPAPLQVLLVERGVAGGSLQGEVPLSADGGPGSLRAVAGDIITAAYQDLDDGSGTTRTTTAQIQISACPAPVLGRVTIAAAGRDSVVAHWSTDQPSTSEMTLTPSSGPALSIADLGLVTGHRIQAFGAVPCQVYAASLASENAEGVRGTIDVSSGLLVETADRQVLFFDDMESPDPGWARSGIHSEWQRGSPVLGPGFALSGLRAFASNPSGPYTGGTDATLTSPPIDLRGVPAPQLTFWHWYEVFGSDTPNSFDDGAWLEVQAQGESPVRVDPSGGYSDLSDGQFGSPLPEGTPVYAGHSIDWERASFDLSPFAGKIVRLRFRLWNDVLEVISNGATGAGWYIDDVEVSAQRFCHPAPSLAPVSLGTALQGESLQDLGIEGDGLRPGAAVSLGAGVTVSSMSVDSPTHITFDLTVDGAAAPGPRDLRVTNPDGQAAVISAGLLVRSSPVASDIDGSGRIDGNDLVQLAAAFGSAEGSPFYRLGPDINRDGIVDGLDLALLAASFGIVLR